MAIKLHGKDYVEVKDRVQAAHAEESYSMLSEESFEMGGRSYVRVYIDVKGKQYIGTAEIKFNAKGNTPDGMSPFECGETSALGRALGFAGYGVVDSIASADEVARNVEAQATEKPKAHPGTEHLTNGNGTPAFPAMAQAPTLADITSLFGKLYKPERFPSFKQMVLERTVADKDLTEDDRVKLWDKLSSIKRATKGNEQPAA